MLVKHDVVPGLMDEMQSMAIFADSRERLDGAGLSRGDRGREGATARGQDLEGSVAPHP